MSPTPRHSLGKRLIYDFLRVVCRLIGVLFYRVRVRGREHWPQTEGALVCANHQSFIDPILVGLCCERRMNYLARKSLFKVTAFRWLIELLDAIPVDLEGSGLAGLKETLKRLKWGEFVLIFPEGTRTTDGELSPLRPGFLAVARKAKVPLVPVLFDGLYQAWPRSQVLPGWGTVHVEIGEPIGLERIAQLGDEELLAEMENRMRSLLARVRRERAHAVGLSSH
ncbi:MAG: lysophospholipid acyltransferase family protein [Pirellulaceae bacterium]